MLYCWIVLLYFAHFGNPKWIKLGYEIVLKLVPNFATFWGAIWVHFASFLGPKTAPKITHGPHRSPWALSNCVLVVSDTAWEATAVSP